MNNSEIKFKFAFRYSLVQCLCYYCGALSISLNGSSDVSPLATPQLNLLFPILSWDGVSRRHSKDQIDNKQIQRACVANYKEHDLNGHFNDIRKDVLRELYVQEGETSDSDEESAEVEDK